MKKSKTNYYSLLRGLVLVFSMLFVGASLSFSQRAGGGGAKKPTGVQKPSAVKKPTNVQKPAANNNNRASNAGGNRNTNVSNSGNKTNNIGSNNKNVGSNNKVNIDNSKKNVNINVDNSKNIRVNNSRNTAVRRSNNYRPYTRPPYRYGGYRYNCYHPYYYHPYRPFYWGPVWHPWGFFVTTLAVTAIIITVDADVPNPHSQAVPYYAFSMTEKNYQSGPYMEQETDEGYSYFMAGDEYWYDQGVFYIKADDGYTVVAAPVGATIKSMPDNYETITLDDKTVNYYYGGSFYEKSSKGYTVVPPTAGAVVKNLPEGGEEVKLGDITYVKVGETYYQPSKVDNKDMYEVVDVEEDK